VHAVGPVILGTLIVCKQRPSKAEARGSVEAVKAEISIFWTFWTTLVVRAKTVRGLCG